MLCRLVGSQLDNIIFIISSLLVILNGFLSGW